MRAGVSGLCDEHRSCPLKNMSGYFHHTWAARPGCVRSEAPLVVRALEKVGVHLERSRSAYTVPIRPYSPVFLSRLHMYR